MRVVDLSGHVFGKLRVLERAGSLRGARWKCLCALDLGGCGNITFVCSGDLRRSRPVRSCGCDRGGEGRFEKTHGHTSGALRKHGGSPEYVCWRSMIDRCTNPNYEGWSRYGGRGIAVCAAWLSSFEAFFEHVGPRPSSKHSIDRFPNRNGNYEPGNVRWATAKEQILNRDATKLDEWDTKFIRHWRKRGFRSKHIAAAFRVSTGHVSRVVRSVP